MSEYFLDFEGYCKIEADDRDKALAKFWGSTQPPSSEIEEYCYDNVCTESVHPIDYSEFKEETLLWKERVAEKDLEVMLECNFPCSSGSYNSASYIGVGRIRRIGYDAWDFLHAKIAMMRYSGPYRTI